MWRENIYLNSNVVYPEGLKKWRGDLAVRLNRLFFYAREQDKRPHPQHRPANRSIIKFLELLILF